MSHLPQFPRLVSRLRGLEQPLIEVRAWPASGRGECLAALEEAVPVRYLDRRGQPPIAAAELRDFLAEAGRSSGCWFVIDGEIGLPSLGLAAELLSRDQRLIFAHGLDAPPAWLPLDRLPADELLLTATEVEELWIHTRTDPPADGQIDQLVAATDGWFEPTRWILEQPSSPAERIHSHAFRQFLEEHLWEVLPSDQRDLLLELSLVDTLEPQLWADYWTLKGANGPDHGQAMAEIRDLWGLQRGEDVPRLPQLLIQTLRSRRRTQWSLEQERAAYRLLAQSAEGQGQQVDSVRYLALAGEDLQLAKALENHRSQMVFHAPLEWLEQSLPESLQGTDALDWWRGLVVAARGGTAPQVEKLLAGARSADGDDPWRELLSRLALEAAGLVTSGLGTEHGEDETLFRALLERLGGRRGSRRGRVRSPVSASRRYRLDLFGSPRFTLRDDRSGGELELTCPLRKSFQVMAFLALAPGRRATKHELIEAIWPDADRETIRKNFHPTLSAARKSLQSEGVGEAILYQQGLYALHPVYEWRVDVELFKHRIDEGKELEKNAGEHRGQVLAIWLDAWRLYRGPFLEDHESPWIQDQRSALQRRYLGLLRDVGRISADLGRLEQAMDAYRSVLLEDGFDEAVHVELMRLYAVQGRRDLVRRQFVRLQELLKELSVEPLAETQELYHQLMR